MANAVNLSSVIESKISELQNITFEKYESHSYASGALGSMLQAAIMRLKESDREYMISHLDHMIKLNKA
jgi:hypothetical protein